MPTLDEALQWARGKTIVILDKKKVPVEVCVKKIHAKGACCMAGTSRNLDRQLRSADNEDRDALAREYRSRLDFGVDLIETDLPIQVGALLYEQPELPASKTRFFFLPKNSKHSRLERVRVSDSGRHFVLDRLDQLLLSVAR